MQSVEAELVQELNKTNSFTSEVTTLWGYTNLFIIFIIIIIIVNNNNNGDSGVTTLWRYTNLFIIIIIINY